MGWKMLASALVLCLVLPGPVFGSGSCKVFAIESPLEDNEFNSNAADEVTDSGQQPVRDFNLSTIEAKIKTHMQNAGCDCISELVLVGHGEAGKFSVGCGLSETCQANEYIGPDNQAQWGPVMEKLGALMCDGLISEGIRLYGCGVGACQEASQLLHNLAGKAKRMVYSTTETVEGSRLFEALEDTNSWQYGQPGAPAPRPCMLGKIMDAPNLKRGAHTYYRCYCDSKLYVGLQECVSNCRVDLGCFTPGCDKVYVNTYMDESDMNPVLTGGSSPSAGAAQKTAMAAGAWDAGGVTAPTVVKDAGGYKMWFAGDGPTDTFLRIGLATSHYGDTWIKHAANPVLGYGGQGAWDDEGVYNPCVIRDGALFKMWYHGFDGSYSRIGYATSPDGMQWTKHPSNPVLSEGGSGAPDELGLGQPVVIKEQGIYKMWYGCYDGWYWRICYATSANGVVWQKHGGNPVLSENLDWEAWDGGGLGGPAVVKIGEQYVMYFGGRDWYDTHAGIGRAVSSDGVKWTRDQTNPVFFPDSASAWESTSLFHPTLIKDENQGVLWMWYRGSNGTDFAIGQASTPLFPANRSMPWIYLLLD